jgi:hypothetical protein
MPANWVIHFLIAWFCTNGWSVFRLMATNFLLLVQEKVSKENDTLPRCLTLRSAFWNGGQELAA